MRMAWGTQVTLQKGKRVLVWMAAAGQHAGMPSPEQPVCRGTMIATESSRATLNRKEKRGWEKDVTELKKINKK